MAACQQTIAAVEKLRNRGGLRIAIDARCILPQEDGLGTYARNLVSELARLDHPHRLLVLVRPEARRELAFLEERDHLDLVVTSIPSMKLSQQIRVPLLLRKIRPDVYHYLAHDAPILHRVPTAITVQDLNYLTFSDYYSSWGWAKRGYSRLVTALSAHKAKWVMVPSEATRSLLVARWPQLRSRITVVPYGVHERYRRELGPAELCAVLGAYGLVQQRYFLFVGTDRPHKNLRRLADAFVSLPQPMRSSVRLAVAGAHRYGTSPSSCATAPAGLVSLGYVPTEHLPALYRGALAFVMPSLGEGFGLPALEAMTAGTPVIVSRGTALAEVVGDAGLLVDPFSTSSIAGAMEAVAAEAVLRERLVRAGRERSGRFSFAETARCALSIYEALGWEESTEADAYGA
jgi:alpha-1,3-rhamnosyl/mannosyltransferase